MVTAMLLAMLSATPVFFRFELIFPPPNCVDEMVERFFHYRDQADMYDPAAVTLSGLLLTNVRRERDGLRNELAAAREETAQAIRNEGVARAREMEETVAPDNDRNELVPVRNCLTLFREWLRCVRLCWRCLTY